MTAPDTETIEQVKPDQAPTEPGDHERFSHYAPKDKITEAMVNGTPIRALCGKLWVPSRDASKFPVCPDCQYIYEHRSDGSPRP
jgi:hypothetical protein